VRVKPAFFPTPEDFRKWFEEHHESARELLVGFYKKASGKPSITWPESVDEALCFGWIDGIRRTIDDEAYTIRFTPRRPRSNWSAVNLKRVEELTKLGRMRPAGLRAYEARDPARCAIYSYEQEERPEAVGLSPAYEAKLKANKKAWTFFQEQAPYYRRLASRWVMTAKKEETQLKRLATLIDDSARGRWIAGMARPAPSKSRRK
jgi:uncharacterized protein YdeI (YjbR/CyaY-like superfamily)